MRKTLKSFALGAITIGSVFSAMPSWAQGSISATASYKALACNGGTSLFEKARGTDKDYDIGNTKLKSVLINAGDEQTAAVQVLYSYRVATPTDFSSLLINFRDDGQTRNRVKIHFCFRGINGGISGFEKKLTDFEIRTVPTGDWSYATIKAADLNFEPENKFRLEKIVVSLGKLGNVQIGNTNLGIRTKVVSLNSTIDLNEVGPCTYVHNCKDIEPGVN